MRIRDEYVPDDFSPELEDRMASEGEADREYARNVGRDHPDQAWILSDRDAWYRNPFYHGPPVPHPEDDRWDDPDDYDDNSDRYDGNAGDWSDPF